MQQSYLVAAIERYERLGTYFGIEVRHALLDIRLLQYSTALPLRYKVRGGWSKYLLRVLADKRLPFSVAWREGWEEIGWKFTVRQEKSMAYGADFRPEEITQSLGNYLEAQLLEELGSLAGNTKLVADFWNYHRLDGWLRQLRNRDLEAAADN